MIKPIEWCGSSLRFLDQTKLPREEYYIETDDYCVVIDAITSLKVRGAPLIGIAASYGVCLAALKYFHCGFESFSSHVQNAIDELAASRPTAVNLFWALERMKRILQSARHVEEAVSSLVHEADTILQIEKESCLMIAKHGAALFSDSVSVLTHCNTGALATGGHGTALGVILQLHKQGKIRNVYVDETSPLLQGARLTTWELKKIGIEPILITDSMAGTLMQQKMIDCVIVGADRIASNGDVANKIGTYTLAVLSHHHTIPFYVAAPTSTIDSKIKNGNEIPIEERGEEELTVIQGQRVAPLDLQTYSPAFDVTPAHLVAAIITDIEVFKSPYSFD
jgi:methylthioribose-1-phosphate isomerase